MMRDFQLRRALTEIAEGGIGTEPELWPGIRAQLGEALDRPPRVDLRRVLAHLSVRAGIIAIILFGALLAGSVYATLPLIQQVLSQTPEGGQLLAYGKTMHLSQTVRGVTVALTFAYADQTGGLLGYTTKGPGDRPYTAGVDQAHLATMRGTPIPITSGYSTGLEGGTSGNFLGFAGVPSTERNKVNLRLIMESMATSGPTGRSVSGPWVFDFTVPITPSRIVEPRQTVTANDWPITLENIAVTRPGTWLVLRGAGPNADVELTAGGKTYHLYQDGGYLGLEAKSCFAEGRRCPEIWEKKDVTYVASAMEPAGLDGKGLQENKPVTAAWLKELWQAGGEWTITVRPDSSFANPIFDLRGGPWVFNVQMPGEGR